MPSPSKRIAPVQLLSLGVQMVLATAALAHTTQKETPIMSPAKQQIVSLLKSLETGEAEPVKVVNPHKYIQHNLAVGDGLAGLGAVLQAAPKGSINVNTVRVIQDGNYVIAHTDYNFFGPKIGFDIFRFENGNVVEHWDNLQEKPAQPNPAGRTMIDGPTDVADLHHTAANKALVRGFVDQVLVGGQFDKLTDYIDPDHYLQHNPAIGDGIPNLASALQTLAQAGTPLKFERMHALFGEGNFVLAVSEGEFLGKHVAFYDLFRVQAGKIVEHWDTIEAIPPRSEWKNTNGKFGF